MSAPIEREGRYQQTCLDSCLRRWLTILFEYIIRETKASGVHCAKPATNVVFPGVEFGSTDAVVVKKSQNARRWNRKIFRNLTLIEKSSHSLVVSTNQGIILKNMDMACP